VSNREKQRHVEMTRRAALRSLASLSAVGLASRLGLPSLARAASSARTERRFLFCYFPGGWDQLLFLDPRDPDADGGRYGDANRAVTLTETGYGALGHEFAPKIIRAGNLTFGPATEKPNQTGPRLSKYADRMAILRGMSMGTLGHEVGYRYFLTGRFPRGSFARGSSIATECAALEGADGAIPVLSLGLETYNEGYPGIYSGMRVESIDDLLVVLERGKAYLEKDPVEDALAEYARRTTSCAVDVYDCAPLSARMRAEDEGTRATLLSNLAERFRFVTASDAESVEIRRRYDFAAGAAGSAGARAAFAAMALKRGISRCVSVVIGNRTDTHDAGSLLHARALHPGIAALAALIDDLATSEAPEALQKEGGRTWLDHTTILAFSEFARTPLFNSRGGRDHHLASSCLLVGAGIAGNRVVGETGIAGMAACRYDFAAGRVVPEGGESIGPEHVRATLLASAGLPTEAAGIHAPPIRELLERAV